jgi:hypothetical protein
MNSPWQSFALLGLFHFGSVGAQIGVDQCACFPSTYTFVLDLGQLCSQTSLPSSGIESSTCSVLSESGAVLTGTNMFPVSVSEITVFELGQDLGTAIISTQIPGNSFITGGSFTYTSSSVGTQDGLDSSIASGVFPRGLELQLRGLNLFSEIVDNRFTIVFSNECDVFPVVQEGDQIGWVKFVSNSFLAVKCSYLALEVCTEFETHDALLLSCCRAPFPIRLMQSARWVFLRDHRRLHLPVRQHLPLPMCQGKRPLRRRLVVSLRRVFYHYISSCRGFHGNDDVVSLA